MATLALSAAGAAVGGALLPAGVSVLGTTLTGAAIGSQIGALAGSAVDQALFGSSGQRAPVEGPRLSELQVLSSSEGTPIPRLYGAMRLAGQVIWATELEEDIIRGKRPSGGGKAAGIGGSRSTTDTIEYRYFANFAVGLCEGEITRVGRIWADGNEIDPSEFTWRVHTGSDDQLPDPLIVAKQGSTQTPAFRGLAYIVFERLPLARFGNRIPQLNFEVIRSVDEVEQSIRAAVIIPGAGEFAYEPQPVTRDAGAGITKAENVHTRQGDSDWSVSMDQMQQSLPNMQNASLVVSWFGDSLLANACELTPRVETNDKQTKPVSWSVAGLTRQTAQAVSFHDGRPAYGGTPSDSSVLAAIRDLKDRGLAVTFNPFILMDAPGYPWRGRITSDPAGDQTQGAADAVAAFTGAAQVSDFAVSGDSVSYSGPSEWSYRRMILHYAHLCTAAGDVDTFLLGSELRGLTTIRSARSAYPFVDALTQLAADVRTVLGPDTKITYAADWSEYFGYQPDDDSGDVHFHLDPLWASSDVDAIAIDVYWPLADWRDTDNHADEDLADSTYDLNYLRANIQGGEGYDWYYASEADRNAQNRTPITDSLGKPWTFRFKDIANWWANPHYNRIAGVEQAAPTSWQPRSKPIWFTEIGCPAVDKGANQPNVFVDPKSTESHTPYFSSGTRDDLIQRRTVQALTSAFDPSTEEFNPDINPLSDVYGDRMVDITRQYVYAWDARPHPAFPSNTNIWGDAPNWRFGHWINGRIANAPLQQTVQKILHDYGQENFDASGINGTLTGYLIDRVMSPRQALQPLELSHFFDAVETGGQIRFQNRDIKRPVTTVPASKLVETRSDAPRMKRTRMQETDLPRASRLAYIGSGGDYSQAIAAAQRSTSSSETVAIATLPVVLDHDRAEQAAHSWLFESWTARERASFELPPSALSYEPGDVVTLEGGKTVRLTEVSDHGSRAIAALSFDVDVYKRKSSRERSTTPPPVAVFTQPETELIELPTTDAHGDGVSPVLLLAAHANPWPGSISALSSASDAGFELRGQATAPATMGDLIEPLPTGPTCVRDQHNTITVRVAGNELETVSELDALNGVNACAIQRSDGTWEVLNFQNATLIAPSTYHLTTLIRGRFGTGAQAVPSGARFVLLDEAVIPLDVTSNDIERPLNWKLGPSRYAIDHATYTTSSFTLQGQALKPLAPVHLKVSIKNDDTEISWIRQTRISGDSWVGEQVPLGEETEAYRITISVNGETQRTIESTGPAATYPASDRQQDLGNLSSSFSITVAQLSAAIGAGAPTTITVNP